jgi:hypothetical protein
MRREALAPKGFRASGNWLGDEPSVPKGMGRIFPAKRLYITAQGFNPGSGGQ